MRKKIQDILNEFKIKDICYLGNGAKNSMSEIHLKINKSSTKIRGCQFAIQFEETSNTIAIWDLRTRLSLNASLDLYVQNNMQWRSIKKIFKVHIAIGKRNSEVTSLCAVMPLDQFREFLTINEYFNFEIDLPAKSDELESYVIDGNDTEGRIIKYYGRRYERDSELRRRAIEIQGYQCSICKFDFEKTYGTVGKGYIEVHHIKPLYEGEQCPDPETDLICICANCHRMIHRKKYSVLTPDELRGYLEN